MEDKDSVKEKKMLSNKVNHSLLYSKRMWSIPYSDLLATRIMLSMDVLINTSKSSLAFVWRKYIYGRRADTLYCFSSHSAGNDRRNPTLRHQARKDVINLIQMITERDPDRLSHETLTKQWASDDDSKAEIVSPYPVCGMEATLTALTALRSLTRSLSGKHG